MNKKRIATAYLTSGKELKIVFDVFKIDTYGITLLLEDKLVAYLPFSLPIAVEDYVEKDETFAVQFGQHFPSVSDFKDTNKKSSE
jgi:hypothetical protein